MTNKHQINSKQIKLYKNINSFVQNSGSRNEFLPKLFHYDSFASLFHHCKVFYHIQIYHCQRFTKIRYYFTSSPQCSREFRVIFVHYLMHFEVFFNYISVANS